MLLKYKTLTVPPFYLPMHLCFRNLNCFRCTSGSFRRQQANDSVNMVVTRLFLIESKQEIGRVANSKTKAGLSQTWIFGASFIQDTKSMHHTSTLYHSTKLRSIVGIRYAHDQLSLTKLQIPQDIPLNHTYCLTLFHRSLFNCPYNLPWFNLITSLIADQIKFVRETWVNFIIAAIH